ncbi:hypothetical protein LguiB_001439 [Lonicera macranthoides]
MDLFPMIPENQPENHIALFLKNLSKPLQIDNDDVQVIFTSDDPFIRFEDFFRAQQVPPQPQQTQNLEVVDPDDEMETQDMGDVWVCCWDVNGVRNWIELCGSS